MQNRPDPPLADLIGTAFYWWREAGVDCDFHEEPQNWLAPDDATAEAEAAPPPPPVRKAPSAPAASPPIGGDRAQWPATLAEFEAWWMSEPSLGQFGGGRRVPPRGPRGAPLMVLVPEPEREDGERLLSADRGALLDAMLGAMGIGADEAYVASVLPSHIPFADWPRIQESGMDAVLARHISLAAPRRLIVFGTGILPLIGHNPAQTPDFLPNFNHEGVSVPVLAAQSLDMIAPRGLAKAGLWRLWLDWTGNGI